MSWWEVLGCVNPLSTWMTFMTRKKQAVEQRDLSKSLEKLDDIGSILDKRMKAIEAEITSIQTTIPTLMQQKKKERALFLFKKKRRLENMIKLLQRQLNGVEMQRENLDMAWTQRHVVASAKEFVRATDGIISANTLKDLDNTLEKMEESQKGIQSLDINFGMFTDRAEGVAFEDDDALLKEFESAYMPREVNSNPGQTFPPIPISALERDRPTHEETKEELEELIPL